MKTMINIKTDVKIKKEAQKVARQMGIPLSAIINSQLRQLVVDRRATFEAPYKVRLHVARQLEKASEEMDAHPERYKSYTDVGEFTAHLDSIRRRAKSRKR